MRPNNLPDTFEDTGKQWCLFPIIFFTIYELFCSISQDQHGRHKVPEY